MGSMGFLLSLQETSAFAFIAWCLHSIVGLKFRYADMYDLMTCQPLRPLNPWHSPCPLSPQMRGSPSFGTLFFFPPAGCCWSCSFHLAYMCLPLWLLLHFPISLNLLLERSLPWFFHLNWPLLLYTFVPAIHIWYFMLFMILQFISLWNLVKIRHGIFVIAAVDHLYQAYIGTKWILTLKSIICTFLGSCDISGYFLRKYNTLIS